MQALELKTSDRVHAQTAAKLIRDSGFEEAVSHKLPGDFGISAAGIALLETIQTGIDLALQIADVVPASRAQNALGWIVIADLLDPITISDPMEFDGLAELLDRPTPDFIEHALRLASVHATQTDAPSTFVTLLADAFLRLPILTQQELELSKAFAISIDDRNYIGLRRQHAAVARELLPVSHDQIVGNDEYIERGLRLAKDVAAFDRRTRKNPKRVNPVLFGLGRPGCGKTVSAHAIGNFFLDFCDARDVPAQFIVVRRTDWASSFQNASAANLVTLFKDAHDFDGVTGFYWPDIDTAFASRSDQGLRSEEKQNLGAAFGVFDGTLLPKDGSWFLICDANTMNMDPATVSRIAQQPCDVHGPSTPEDFVALTRDIFLKDVARWVPEDGWVQFGERCVQMELSGRNVESVANNVIARVQDFDFPDEYFTAVDDEKVRIAQSLYVTVTWDDVFEELAQWEKFHKQAEEAADQERFEREVKEMVRRLNAQNAVIEQMRED